MRADFQFPLADPKMVQQVRHQGDGRVDDPEHRFLLESDIVQSQKHHAVKRKKERRRDGDPEGRDEEAETLQAAEEEQAPEDDGDPDRGHILDIRV